MANLTKPETNLQEISSSLRAAYKGGPIDPISTQITQLGLSEDMTETAYKISGK